MARRKVSLDLSQASSADSFPELSPIADSNNLVFSPAGDTILNRNGSEIVRKYAKVLSGNRTVIRRETRPPNLNDGNELLFLQSYKGIVELSLFKPRTNLPTDSLLSTVQFQDTTYYADAGSPVVVTVLRTGALDRTIAVSYATSNGTASAGTDYTATTGTLTFASGETSKTISVPTIVAAQVVNKTGFLTLSNPTGGAVVGGQNPITFVIMASYMPTGAVMGTASLTAPTIALMYDSIAHTVTAHYLAGYVGQTGTISDNSSLYRVGPDQLVFYTTVPVTGGYETWGNVYSINQMRIDGGAYSAGAGTIAAAIKTQPQFTYLVQRVQTSQLGVENGHIYPYSWDMFYRVDRGMIMGVSLSNKAVATVAPFPNVTGATGAVVFHKVSPVISWGKVNYQGYIVEIVYDTNSSGNVNMLLIDPRNGTLVAQTGWFAQSVHGQMYNHVPTKTGDIIVHDEVNAKFWRLSADLKTWTSLGAHTNYSASFLPINQSDTIWMMAGTSSPGAIQQIAVGATSVTTAHTYHTGAEGKWFPGFNTTNETRAFDQYYENAGNNKLNIVNTVTFAVTVSTNNTDQFSGGSVDARITGAAGNLYVPDFPYYHARFIAGQLR